MRPEATVTQQRAGREMWQPVVFLLGPIANDSVSSSAPEFNVIWKLNDRDFKFLTLGTIHIPQIMYVEQKMYLVCEKNGNKPLARDFNLQWGNEYSEGIH